eukprot:Skav235525  [mRNA]  locus=scaffold3067:14461:15133:- [translate_table: standard]
MMREEIANGIGEMEKRLMSKLTAASAEWKAALQKEKGARTLLEERDFTMAGTEVPIGLVSFGSRAQAFSFIRTQERNRQIQDAQLWVAENKSRTERSRAKIVSKLKKFLVQIGEHAPREVVVHYKTFQVMVRDGGKLVPVAKVSPALEVSWLNDNVATEEIKAALMEVIADME